MATRAKRQQNVDEQFFFISQIKEQTSTDTYRDKLLKRWWWWWSSSPSPSSYL